MKLRNYLLVLLISLLAVSPIWVYAEPVKVVLGDLNVQTFENGTEKVSPYIGVSYKDVVLGYSKSNPFRKESVTMMYNPKLGRKDNWEFGVGMGLVTNYTSGATQDFGDGLRPIMGGTFNYNLKGALGVETLVTPFFSSIGLSYTFD